MFTFTGTEQKGVIALAILCVLAFVVPRTYLYFKPATTVSNTAANAQVAAFVKEYEQHNTDTAQANVPVNEHHNTAANRTTSNHSVTTQPLIIDINKAGADEFEKLNGIGAVLATRIVKFRGVLGGFASVTQLHEVYGLPDSTFKRISKQLIVKPGQVQQVNINTGSYKNFKAHPYLRPFAKDIESYRNKNGNYKQVADLKSITGITDSIYRKIAPYIAVE